MERKSQINSRTEKGRKGQGKKENAKEKKGESKTMDYEVIVEETESGDSEQEGQTGVSTKGSESETNSKMQSTNSIDTNRNRIETERTKTDENSKNKGNKEDRYKKMVRFKEILQYVEEVEDTGVEREILGATEESLRILSKVKQW